MYKNRDEIFQLVTKSTETQMKLHMIRSLTLGGYFDRVTLKIQFSEI